MLTEAEAQERYRQRTYELATSAVKKYWQSMWEKSMHNPKNKPVAAEPEYTEADFNWPSSPGDTTARHGHVEMLGDLPDTAPENPRNPCPPRTAWSKDPWPDVKGTQCPPASEASFSDKDLSILTEAHGLVHGDRQATYGHPAVDFARTAALVNTLLASKLSKDLGPEDVALFMVAVKLSREVHQHGRDNLVDACGYLECLSRVKRFTGSVEGK